ncbi:hypothetical protein [Runella zeae]|uniref:hypothetical protein n=1 Tax=Runella zeae TaxID=94255 RepID=UPI002356FB1F|nr:hypothetical protein [Runella zeae]
MLDQNKLSITERITAPTPKLFTIIRNLGIVLAALSGAIIAIQQQGLELPTWVSILSDKVAWIAGLIAAIVSQLTVDFKKLTSENALANLGNLADKKKA